MVIVGLKVGYVRTVQLSPAVQGTMVALAMQPPLFGKMIFKFNTTLVAKGSQYKYHATKMYERIRQCTFRLN